MRSALAWAVIAGLSLGAGGWAVAVDVAAASPAAAVTTPAESAADTAGLVDAALARRRQATPADRQAAQRLLREGDQAYRQRAYGAAYKAYSSAYPNHPSAYAYLMSGDARWRAMLQAKARAEPDAQGCRLDNAHFAHDLSQDLAQHHRVGLALARRPGDRRVGATLQRRAEAGATCLDQVAHQHRHRPATDCVDLAAVRRCLGAPLLH